jgi:hypothetical protein
MNPKPENVTQNFDYEVPCYVYGYYNGEDPIMDEYEEKLSSLGTVPGPHNKKKTPSTSFKEKMRDKMLEKVGFPKHENFINEPLLLQIGDGSVIFEARITAVSENVRAAFIEPTHKPYGRTISDKMVGWWLFDKLRLVDKINVTDSKTNEKDMHRNIL